MTIGWMWTVYIKVWFFKEEKWLHSFQNVLVYVGHSVAPYNSNLVSMHCLFCPVILKDFEFSYQEILHKRMGFHCAWKLKRCVKWADVLKYYTHAIWDLSSSCPYRWTWPYMCASVSIPPHRFVTLNLASFYLVVFAAWPHNHWILWLLYNVSEQNANLDFPCHIQSEFFSLKYIVHILPFLLQT